MKYEDLTKDDKKYLKGNENTAIRWYFYLNSGLNVLNQFRNLFLGIFALYVAFKLQNPVWLFVMLIPCLPLLAMLGWYQTHRMAKINEWLGMRFSTHYAIKAFNFQQSQMDLLTEIRDLLEKQK